MTGDHIQKFKTDEDLIILKIYFISNYLPLIFFLNKYEFLKLNKDFRHTLNDIFMQSK